MLGNPENLMKDGSQSFMSKVIRVPWTIVCFVLRFLRRFCLTVGVCVVTVFLAYMGFESIVGMLDSHFSEQIDSHLNVDKNPIARLHDPAYFAEQSVLV